MAAQFQFFISNTLSLKKKCFYLEINVGEVTFAPYCNMKLSHFHKYSQYPG